MAKPSTSGKYGTILYEVRDAFGLDNNRYLLLDAIMKLQGSPKAKTPGYCDAGIEYLASVVGVDRRNILKMLKKMEGDGLVERHPTSRKCRVTAPFYDAANGDERSPDRVTKRHSDGDERSPKSGDERSPYNTKNIIHDNNREIVKQKPSPAEVLEDYLSSKTAFEEKEKSCAKKEKEAGLREIMLENLTDEHRAKNVNNFYGHRSGMPPAPLISITESTRADTPLQLENAMRKFYAERPDEYAAGIMENAHGKNYTSDQRAQILKDFCAHRIEIGKGSYSYARQNAALQSWFRNEKYAAWKKPQKSQNSSQAVYVAPTGNVLQ